MAKFITTKYGTKINVEGLTPEQIARVRAIAENKGAYGAKGAALAKELQKKVAAPPATGGPATDGGAGGQEPQAETPTDAQAGLTPRQEQRLAWLLKNRPKDPQIAKLQAIKNKVAQNPGGGADADPGTTGLGDTGTTIDNFIDGVFKDLKPLDLTGTPKILGADDLQAERQSVYDSVYRQSTKDFERQKQLRMEETKQELAQRGIPIGFGDDNLYGQAIGDIERDFDAKYQAAMDSANVQADQSLATLSGVNNQNRDSFMKAAMAQYQAQLDAASAGGSILSVLMQKYGIDKDEAQKILDRELTKKIAKDDYNAKMAAVNKSGGGGGGGGGGDGFNITIGGVAP